MSIPCGNTRLSCTMAVKEFKDDLLPAISALLWVDPSCAAFMGPPTLCLLDPWSRCSCLHTHGRLTAKLLCSQLPSFTAQTPYVLRGNSLSGSCTGLLCPSSYLLLVPPVNQPHLQQLPVHCCQGFAQRRHISRPAVNIQLAPQLKLPANMSTARTRSG